MYEINMKKNVIITGGTRGIGRSILDYFANRGFNVAFTYRSSDEEAKNIILEYNKKDISVFSVKADMRDEGQVTGMVEAVKKQFGPISILVNNAGITNDKLFLTMQKEDWRDVIETNLLGCIYATRSVLDGMVKEMQGRIVNISSVSGFLGRVGQTNYSASKAGIVGFTKSLAKEVARFGITVNAVAPGFIKTEMSDLIDEKKISEIKKTIPCRRLGTSEEVADLVYYLASDSASYITGQVFVIDGGLSC
jgi:3-oxoacyl-[acyl-carrier protein] reductase